MPAHTDWIESHDPAYVAELTSWSRAERDAADGIPRYSVVTTAQTRESLFVLRDFDVIDKAGTRVADFTVERPTVIAVGTHFDRPADQFLAGTAFGRLLLAATARGAAASPLGQVVDITLPAPCSARRPEGRAMSRCCCASDTPTRPRDVWRPRAGLSTTSSTYPDHRSAPPFQPRCQPDHHSGGCSVTSPGRGSHTQPRPELGIEAGCPSHGTGQGWRGHCSAGPAQFWTSGRSWKCSTGTVRTPQMPHRNRARCYPARPWSPIATVRSRLLGSQEGLEPPVRPEDLPVCRHPGRSRR